MSEENDKIEEKSSENNTDSEEEKDYLEEMINIKKIKEFEEDKEILKELEKKEPIPFNYKIKMNGNNLFNEAKKNKHRLSCQPVISLLKRPESNSIRKTKIRKKTTMEFSRKESVLFPVIEEMKQYIAKNTPSFNNNNLNKKNIIEKNKNKSRNNLKNNFKILSGHLNIYERSKNHILRKNNYIKKKKDKELQDIENNIRKEFLNENSKKIMKGKTEYIPIEYRAKQLHNKHLIESILNENRNELKKLQEEDKEYEIVREYANRKTFDEDDWEDFINSQEIWMKEKQYKIKAAEVFRNTFDQKEYYIPKIDKNSKKIVSNLRKKILYLDDIHTRLYKDFDILQERKKIRMSKSMPSFKPFLNKKVKISNPENKKINNNINFSKKLDKLFGLLMKKKANKNQNKKSYENKSQVNKNNFDSKTTFSNYINYSNILKNNKNFKKNQTFYERNNFEGSNSITKKYEGNIKMSNKSQNISNKLNYYNNIKQANYIRNIIIRKQNSDIIIQNNKINNTNSDLNIQNDKKRTFFFIRNNNFCSCSRITKRKK